MGHHQKRLSAPKPWRVPRKAHKWVSKPSPGPHPVHRSLPLAVVLRDYLGLVDTDREARRVIGAGDIHVDGRPVKKPKFPVSIFDIISIPKMKKHYRVFVDHRGRIALDSIDEKEAGWKLAKITGKTTIKGGLTQLHFHDGRNLVVVKDTYQTGDTVKLGLPNQEVQGTIPFKKGGMCLVTGGRHAGEVAVLDDVEIKRISGENIAILKEGDKTVRTVKSYVFPIGAKKSEITLPEGVRK
jgi:small subunit ribosomal protein S4e